MDASMHVTKLSRCVVLIRKMVFCPAKRMGRTVRFSSSFTGSACAFIMSVALIAATAVAQNQNGNIHGTVADPSGAMIAGTTVTLASTALLVPQTATTSADGIYHFEQLPIGTYSLSFDQAGFTRYVRENISITAGFSAEVNVKLALGSASQSVTVSAQGPVVDTTSTTLPTDLSAEALTNQLPLTRLVSQVVQAAPGVIATAAPDLGGGGSNGTSTFITYGISGQITSLIEGIDTRQTTGTVDGTWDLTAISDFQVVTSGANAEVALPGIFVNALIRSGGNAFHARGEATGENSYFESNNLTPFIEAQGSTTPQLILSAIDLTGQIGGPIIRDKWWFFVSGHTNRSNRSVVGYLLANGQPGSIRMNTQNETTKTTYQLSKNYKLIGSWDRYNVAWYNEGGSALVPPLNTVFFTWPTKEWKGEIQGTPSSKVVLDFFFGRHNYSASYNPYPDPLGIPDQVDQTTSLKNGPSLEEDQRPRSSWQPTGSIAFLPSRSYLGHHELKFGSTWMYQTTGTSEGVGIHGNYVLTFASGIPAFIGVG